MPLLNKRRPRRRAPSAAAHPAPAVVAEPTPEPTPPTPPKLSSPIVTVERFECPTCGSVVALQHVTSSIDEHPRLHTLQRTITIDCQACGDTTDAKLILINGTWSPETCAPRKRNA